MIDPGTSDFDMGDKIVRDRLPVSLLTGFLGAGKTTLLKYLVAQPAFKDTAVVINEFGEIGLDHMLVEHANEDMVLMSSGCLCCTIRNDLIVTLRRLYKRREQKEIPPFRRLIIETTGLADPAPILHTLMNDPLLSDFYRLDSVITVVDSVFGMGQMDRQMEAAKQAAVADRLIAAKSDLVTDEALDALCTRLRRLNPAAPILKSAHGQVEPERLFGAGLYDPATKTADVRRWLNEEAYNRRDPAPGHVGHAHTHDQHGEHADADPNRHDERIRAFCVNADKPLSWERFVDWVEMLTTIHGEQLLRVKGVLAIDGQDRPVAIHGVQHVFHPPALLSAWPDNDRRSKIVFIVRDLDQQAIVNSFVAVLGGSSPLAMPSV